MTPNYLRQNNLDKKYFCSCLMNEANCDIVRPKVAIMRKPHLQVLWFYFMELQEIKLSSSFYLFIFIIFYFIFLLKMVETGLHN